MHPALTVLVVLCAAAAQPAAAEVYTGRDLLRACSAPRGDADRFACQGWIDWGFSSPHFCLPDAADDGAVRRVLVEWLGAHPGKLHMPGGALVQNALFDTWPCPAQR